MHEGNAYQAFDTAPPRDLDPAPLRIALQQARLYPFRAVRVCPGEGRRPRLVATTNGARQLTADREADAEERALVTEVAAEPAPPNEATGPVLYLVVGGAREGMAADLRLPHVP